MLETSTLGHSRFIEPLLLLLGNYFSVADNQGAIRLIARKGRQPIEDVGRCGE
jgi:hypothetical protein